MVLRAIGVATVVLLMVHTGGLPAQAQPASQHSPAYKTPRKAPANDFDVVDWLSLTPAGNSLIRDPKQAAPVDLTARDDDANITVYGRKKHPDLSAPPPMGYAPDTNEAAEPRDLRIVPPTGCNNAAYSDVGGQPANGSDLIGALGSSAGC